MKLQEIRDIVTEPHAEKFRVELEDGTTKVVRLWNAGSCIAIMNKGKKSHGHELTSWYDHYDTWKSLCKVTKKQTDFFRLFNKRANDAVRMLNESGLWGDIKNSIEYYLSLSEDKQRELVNDIHEDSYEKFYKQTWSGGKYSWVNCHQVFESFAAKKCWKSIAWSKWSRATRSEEVANAIKNKTNYDKSWNNGYDNSLTITFDKDDARGWYSEEYVGCGNGHYYLLFDATHAIFYEDD